MTPRLALALAAALACGGQEGERVPVAPATKPIAGLRGLHVTSRVLFLEAPDDPHELEVVFLFPDRARWTLARAGTDDRLVLYRRGSRLHRLAGAPPADPVEDGGRTLRSLELRRALFLWPDGFAWEGAGTERTAALVLAADPPPAGAEAEEGEPPAPLGRLRVRLGPDGRPRAAVVEDEHGAPQESLRVLGWGDHGGRTFPARLVLAVEGTDVWEEEVRSVSTAVRFLEEAFEPPGERSDASAAALDEPALVRLPAHSAREIALPAGAGWEAARAAERAARDRAAGGPPLDPVPTFAVDENGRPRAVLLRLAPGAEPPGPLPEGFARVPEREGISLFLAASPSAAALARARAAVPVGRRPDRAYVRLYDDGARVQLALPLLP